jgi:hypothetical protein
MILPGGFNHAVLCVVVLGPGSGRENIEALRIESAWVGQLIFLTFFSGTVPL